LKLYIQRRDSGHVLEKIYFGSGAYGVEAASNTYFWAQASENLTLAEASLLAGLPQAPNAYNPFKYMDRAKNRQRLVLNNMVACGYITQETADKAFNTQITLNSKVSNGSSKYGYYTDAVIDEALDIIKGSQVFDDPNAAVYKAV
jgi:penicillin-binding protein 1A